MRRCVGVRREKWNAYEGCMQTGFGDAERMYKPRYSDASTFHSEGTEIAGVSHRDLGSHSQLTGDGVAMPRAVISIRWVSLSGCWCARMYFGEVIQV